MRNAILLILVGIIGVSLITIGAAYAIPQEVPSELIPSSTPIISSSQDKSEGPFLLRTYDGKLAVFTSDLVEPDLLFEVYVRTLPISDQKALEKGVRVETYEKLTALIEDYIS